MNAGGSANALANSPCACIRDQTPLHFPCVRPCVLSLEHFFSKYYRARTRGPLGGVVDGPFFTAFFSTYYRWRTSGPLVMFWTPGPKRRPKRCFQDPFRTNATPTRAPEPLQNDARNDVSRIRSEPTQHLHELRKHFKTTSETTLPGSVRNQCNPYTTSGGAPKRRPKLHFQDPFRTNATFFSSNKFVFFSIPDCVSHSRARVSCRALRAVPMPIGSRFAVHTQQQQRQRQPRPYSSLLPRRSPPQRTCGAPAGTT